MRSINLVLPALNPVYCSLFHEQTSRNENTDINTETKILADLEWQRLH
jgi:hypothetical protein